MSNEFNLTSPSQLTILATGEATFSANTKTFGKFAEKGVSLASGIKPIAPAKNSKVTQFIFPIGAGTLATDYSAGTIPHHRWGRNHQDRQNRIADLEDEQPDPNSPPRRRAPNSKSPPAPRRRGTLGGVRR